jgi:RNA-directed DNA polymerase
VILCRKRAHETLAEAEGILSRLGLALNRSKTRICCAHTEPFDFLGYSFGVQYQFGNGRKYLAAYPSVTVSVR